MSAHMLALVLGLFVVPVAALVLGHRLARRSARARGAFWGVVIGHTAALLLATAAALYLPVRWSGDDTMRGLVGLWGMLVLGVFGGVAGYLLAEGEERDT